MELRGRLSLSVITAAFHAWDAARYASGLHALIHAALFPYQEQARAKRPRVLARGKIPFRRGQLLRLIGANK
jgi:hypothetical protein